MDIVSIFIGLFLGIVVAAIIGAAILLIRMAINAQFRKVLVLVNLGKDKPPLEIYDAKTIEHTTLGTVYYVPKLKQQNRIPFIKFFGQKEEYALRNGKSVCFLTSSGVGDYAPMDIILRDKIKTQAIEAILQKDVKGKKTTSYEFVEKETEDYILKTTPIMTRQFAVESTLAASEEYKIKISFWDKHLSTVVAGGAILLTLGMVAFISLLAFDWLGKMLNSPEVMQTVGEAVGRGVFIAMQQMQQNATGGPPLTPP